MSPTKLRITSAKPKPDFLMTLAYRYYIYDKAIHEKMENKALYGSKSASTTGAYKLISISPNKGVHIQRNDAAVNMFPHLRAPIKNVKGVPIPDEQTQVAALLTGQVHVIRLSTQDQVKNLGKIKLLYKLVLDYQKVTKVLLALLFFFYFPIYIF